MDAHEKLKARITALETVVIDMMALAAREMPELRPAILQSLSKAAEELTEAEDPAAAAEVEIICEDFRQTS